MKNSSKKHLELIHTGVQIGEHLLTVGVHSIICDAPARAMVKGITQFNGFYGCDQCEVKGVYQGCMLFMENDCRLRTDESFRSQTNKLHHRVDSPFCKLPIDMISQFPIDYMHQVNLGVTRKLLVIWTGSGCLKQGRLAALHINRISSNLVKMKQYIHCEFVRKPRSLSDLAMWKASELRQLLLYTGPLALKDVLAPENYMNCLCLSVGVSLLMSEKFVPEHSDYACELLKHSVCEAQRLYGEKFVTYNVHSVIHLADVARRYGSLQNCSAYPFENYMQRLKRLVRSTQNPIVQVANRLSELKAVRGLNSNSHHDQKRIKDTQPDNCYKLQSNRYCLVHDVRGGSDTALCEVFHHTIPLYMKPCDSRILGIQCISMRHREMEWLPLGDLQQKALFLPQSDTTAVIIPFLHSIYMYAILCIENIYFI